jgi:hypothetical protein
MAARVSTNFDENFVYFFQEFNNTLSLLQSAFGLKVDSTTELGNMNRTLYEFH